ncbi:GNAT family N-acetyltransferase [Flavobacterium sp. ENC]|uniref:GNAT family N-acetyltransferase n=1 Tax=Flavobacterium sp. ENC TaxID=2897330 RepID=UPI001E5748C1|nr:GNAT family N-acetyltransferase [Flavobacterium sp. ENC]MCD0464070.1 GNAT family N-acetyltransferase [Flavobacterium sp. ENC]
MYTTNKISHEISDEQTFQILNLVAQDANLISVNVFQRQSPIFEYLMMREIMKTRTYLVRLGDFGARATHLLTTEYNGIIVGYILYHRSLTSAKDIAIISTIVDRRYRKQGILKNMMNILKGENDSISLTCFANRVPVYEKLGFVVFMQQETQICMYYGYTDDGDIISVDDEYIDQIDVVINARKKFQDDNPGTWQTLWKQQSQDNSAEIRNAELFLHSRTN